MGWVKGGEGNIFWVVWFGFLGLLFFLFCGKKNSVFLFVLFRDTERCFGSFICKVRFFGEIVAVWFA